MLSTATPSSTSFTPTYDRSGALSLFRSEPAQRIAVTTEKNSTTRENYKDKVTLSESGIEQSRQSEDTDTGASRSTGTTGGTQQKIDNGQTSGTIQELTIAEEKAVQQLKARDQEVKTHEMAHLANAGQYARGGPTYSYQQGPDGRRYAIGGEVPIDISKEKSAEETIQKMQAVKRAATAPANPSSADRSIAAAASATESRARQELQAEKSDAAETEKQDQIANDPETTAEDPSLPESIAGGLPLDDTMRPSTSLDIVA